MSGHSKWASIKHKKAIVDQRRGQHFTKLARAITVAARDGGGDPEMNAPLGNAVQKAKDASMPKDNIERAILKGTGAGADAAAFEEVVYEGYGPGGVALLIETLTDNRNRTAADMRHILSKRGGTLGHARQRRLPLQQARRDPRRRVPLHRGRPARRDRGGRRGRQRRRRPVRDRHRSQGSRRPCVRALEEAGVEFEGAEVTQQPTTRTAVDEETAEKLMRLIESLDENDDVNEVHANFDVPADVLQRVAG